MNSVYLIYARERGAKYHPFIEVHGIEYASPADACGARDEYLTKRPKEEACIVEKRTTVRINVVYGATEMLGPQHVDRIVLPVADQELSLVSAVPPLTDDDVPF